MRVDSFSKNKLQAQKTKNVVDDLASRHCQNTSQHDIYAQNLFTGSRGL